MQKYHNVGWGDTQTQNYLAHFQDHVTPSKDHLTHSLEHRTPSQDHWTHF